nr:thioredoxin domain-containing protein [Methanogenium marinum]
MVGKVTSSVRYPGAVVEVTDMNFTDLIQSHQYFVVGCWAEWCGSCTTMAPIIEELAGEFGGEVMFGTCDAEMNLEVMASFHILAIPTLLFFANGSLVGRLTGVHPKESIHASLLRVFVL